ncbi:hypothetical protein PVK06_039514 [Gossypium arboreum]|uniref:Uncharacterized protein n=1 Tax=Gossypium arboreum TaxID=29729 RepID=A0ABR0N319_GOSAR|nr:hypothetical protein PVK06_039514 [Gossypium arboreum]
MRPSQLKSNSRDKYSFYNDRGHKIEDCFSVKDAIEEAIRNYELKDFVAQEASPSGQSSRGADKVTLGDSKHTTTKYVQFFVTDHLMAYNAILGHPIMRMARMIFATFCMKIKFPTKMGISFMKSNQRLARQCYMLSVK